MQLVKKIADFSTTYERILSEKDLRGTEFIWNLEAVRPFNEAIISWNGMRSGKGKWTLYVSLHQQHWSPWLKYAEWTPTTQKTFKTAPQDSFAETYQDAAQPKSGHCDALRVKIIAEEGATLFHLDSLYACLSHSPLTIREPPDLPPLLLSNVPRQSQIVLDHPRNTCMCSPTSTSTAINYLLRRKAIDPLLFASRSHDSEFDIYGNWILNTAEAYQQLNGAYRVYVQRLNDFTALYSHLKENCPVVVSIKGPIPGAPQVYNSGHLICVIGYENRRVLSIDPAAPDNESTFVSYALQDFLQAWSLRRNIAYLFTAVPGSGRKRISAERA